MPSGGVIREKAKKIVASQGKEFNASEGWFAKFKLRFNIQYKKATIKDHFNKSNQLTILIGLFVLISPYFYNKIATT